MSGALVPLPAGEGRVRGPLRLFHSGNVRLELCDDVFQLFIHDQVIEEVGAVFEECQVVERMFQAFADLRFRLASARAEAKEEGAQHRAAAGAGREETAAEDCAAAEGCGKPLKEVHFCDDNGDLSFFPDLLKVRHAVAVESTLRFGRNVCEGGKCVLLFEGIESGNRDVVVLSVVSLLWLTGGEDGDALEVGTAEGSEHRTHGGLSDSRRAGKGEDVAREDALFEGLQFLWDYNFVGDIIDAEAILCYAREGHARVDGEADVGCRL